MTTTYTTYDEAYDAGTEWIDNTQRHEMLDFLMETASPEFKDNLVNEMVNWMGASDFADFFKHIRRHWDIKTPQELDYLMNH